jgi:hypothetical protein
MRTNPKLIGALLVGSCLPLWAQPPATLDTESDVTVPNGIEAGSPFRQSWSYGNALLSTIGLSGGGTIVSDLAGPVS